MKHLLLEHSLFLSFWTIYILMCGVTIAIIGEWIEDGKLPKTFVWRIIAAAIALFWPFVFIGAIIVNTFVKSESTT